MDWKPTEEQKKYLKLIISISTECLLGKGTDSANTFVELVKMAADALPQRSDKK